MSRLSKKIGTLLIICLALVLAGLDRMFIAAAPLHSTGQPVTISTATDIVFPPLTGPYKVGRVSYEWVDQSRDEFYASVPGLKRDLMVDMWFPADPAKRAKVAPYMENSAMWKLVVGQPELESTVHARAYVTNAIAADKPNYPVLLFEPETTIPVFYYTTIIEELASHGYIVVGLSHPFNTAAVSYPDGRFVVERADGSALPTSMDDETVRYILAKDIHFVLNQLTQFNSSNPDFKGKLDLTRIGMIGHFYGGLIAQLSTSSEPLIKAGASLEMDPALQMTSPNKPYLYMGIGAAPRSSEQTKDSYWVYSSTMTISNFGDFALLQPQILVPTIGTPGSIDPARGVQIVNSYLVAFFDHYLNGADLKWPSYDEIKLVTFPLNGN